MYYLSVPPKDGNYGNPHFPARDGDIALPDEWLLPYLNTKGYAIFEVNNGVITHVSRNEAAYAEHDEEQTEIDRLEARILYDMLHLAERIERFYCLDMYTKRQVGEFVENGWLTAEQYEDITGEQWKGE